MKPTPPQLLMPRFECIADYPRNSTPIGTIIELSPQIIALDKNAGRTLDMSLQSFIKRYAKYPAIFRPLPWHSHRPIDDMPEYVKYKSRTTKEYKVWEVSNWGIRNVFNVTGLHFEYNGSDFHIENYHEPATELDYTNYLATKK